ncbi:MAG: WbqC family protein [Paludibacter sp.]
MNIIAIHQPNYIPWLGYFYKIYQADTFVFLDTVQYSNKGMHDFHYIKNPQGRFRLKTPVKVAFGDSISAVQLNNSLNWRESHLKQIEVNYKKAPFFKDVFSDLSELFKVNDILMADFNSRIIEFIARKFGINTKFVKSSELNVDTLDKSERIYGICNALNGKVYYSGTGASVYQNEEDFQARGIELKYSNYQPFEYPQFWGNFESNISIIDYLMHCGYNWERVVENQK